MKIISCHVDNFGKLPNLDINFNEHVNIINKPNGWGKSTLAAFFSAMLYGFDNKKESGALEKDRKKYQPWQGDHMVEDLPLRLTARDTLSVVPLVIQRRQMSFIYMMERLILRARMTPRI